MPRAPQEAPVSGPYVASASALAAYRTEDIHARRIQDYRSLPAPGCKPTDCESKMKLSICS